MYYLFILPSIYFPVFDDLVASAVDRYCWIPIRDGEWVSRHQHVSLSCGVVLATSCSKFGVQYAPVHFRQQVG